MQLCTATQAYTHYPTATQCREFALLIGPPFEGVTVQINDGVINASSTGACIYNSGGSGKFQLLSTTTIGNICDLTVGGGLCACIPEHEYARCSSHPTESHSSTHTHTHTHTHLKLIGNGSPPTRTGTSPSTAARSRATTRSISASTRSSTSATRPTAKPTHRRCAASCAPRPGTRPRRRARRSSRRRRRRRRCRPAFRLRLLTRGIHHPKPKF